MDASFHYLMTYAAAREAGFSVDRAGQLAIYAQCVDESQGQYKFTHLSNRRVQTGPTVGLQKTQHKEADPQIRDIFGGRHWTGRTADMMILMAFHFLPGLQSPSEVNTGIPIIDDTAQQYALSSEDRLRKLKREPIRSPLKERRVRRRIRERRSRRPNGVKTKTEWKEMLITWPTSWSSTDMMDDTRHIADNECRSNMNGNTVNNLYLWRGTSLRRPRRPRFLAYLRSKRVNINVEDFLLALAGIRMHVYADTYAHQGFSGVRSHRLNDASQRKYKLRYTDTDLPSQRIVLGGYWKMAPNHFITHVGHAQLGALPDYPNCFFTYTRPLDSKTIVRDNPPIYYQAYLHMKQELEQLPDELKTGGRQGARANVEVSISDTGENIFKLVPGEWPDDSRGKRWLSIIKRSDPEARSVLHKNIAASAHKDPQALRQMSITQRNAFSLAASYQLHWLEEMIKTQTRSENLRAFYRKALAGDRSGTSR